jgi:hypothetical protein
MSVASHIAELKKKSDTLDEEVRSRHKRPTACPFELQGLKKQRLRIRDEIRRLESA